jgi:hypothetical protein
MKTIHISRKENTRAIGSDIKMTMALIEALSKKKKSIPERLLQVVESLTNRLL